ncbi:MAG TPA: hypothetical protein VL651_08295 [Bacteroidia bacterium]|jgi:hypothetical protein|nr:hypothetical protein [Bacteroidia bacterium]
MKLLPAILLLYSFTLISNDGIVKFQPLSSGLNSNIFTQQQQLFHSQKDFNDLWQQIHKTESMMADIPPKIDFSKKSVIACFIGNNGHGMLIDSVRSSGTSLTIYEERLTLDQGCDGSSVHDSPFEMIVVNGKNWKVANAQVVEEEMECHGE